MDNPRKTAVEAIGRILKGPAKPKDVLEMLTGDMDPRDRGFVMEVVYGVVRHLSRLDLVLSWLMKKPGGVPVSTLNNLRAGIYQILFMRVPGWAAVNEAVELEGRHRGLVNGVLRNALRSKDELEARLDELERAARGDDPKSAVEAIAATTSHPAWLVRRWVKRLGVEGARELAMSNNLIPPLTLRANTLLNSRGELLEWLRAKGIGCEPTAHSPYGVKLMGTMPVEPLGLGGRALVQDEAAQLVSLMLSPEPGQRVLDACAAPGGKTAHLAALMQDRGEIVSLDNDGARLERLTGNIASQGLGSVRVVQADLLEFADEEGFDAVLLDAPCSALGVIRRNPDIKYRRKKGDLARFANTQLRLLNAASGLLRPGGRLVYAVCSTEPEEGEAVVGRFLKSSEDFFIIGKTPVVPDVIAHEFMEGDFMRTWPHRGGLDGFFAALMGKR